MKIASIIFVFALIFAGQVFVACTADESGNDGGQNSNSAQVNTAQTDGENSETVKDNIEELELTIKLPAHPEEVSWQETPSAVVANAAPPVKTKKLTAVLKFNSEDANKIVAQAETYQPSTPAQIETESWFPAELKAQSELSGDETLKGNAYAPNDFLQAPFEAGKLTRLQDSNYFILELSAK